jgi:DNA-directed RNA polymerase III subunit RPC3
MLHTLERDIRQCKQELHLPGTVIDVDEELNPYSLPKLRTDDLQAILTEVPGMADAIGHTDRSKINMARFDHPKKRRRKDPSIPNGDVQMAEVEGQASSDESEHGEDDKGNVSGVDSYPDNPNEWDEDMDYNPVDPVPRKRKRSASPKGPPSPLRQHLFLLSNQPNGFLHHLPASRTSRESWSVDFHGLSRHLLTNSLLHFITNRFGSLATRLVRILQERGKLDEKTLTSSGLLNQKTMRALLTAMNRAGFLELQEVPKGNDRQPSKTIYLWFFDDERCRLRVLDETYKTMTRVLQRIGVEREKVKGTVEKSERVDVQGREEEMLGEEEKKALKDWRAKEERLLGELGKLDDLVAVLRDF